MPDQCCREVGIGAIERYRSALGKDAAYRASRNAVTKTSAKAVATNRDAVVRTNHSYSHVVRAGAATMQNQSGRCWMFAGLNTLRLIAADNMNLEDFELSQNYPMFWDKLEKSNYFLESILSTLDEPTDGRLIQYLLKSPIQDGGQWHMFVNLLEKYGAVPKETMPETESSSATQLMNDRITTKLREFACRLRQGHAEGRSEEELRSGKDAMLAEVYRMLAIHLGDPPKEFLWQWRDKDKNFHRDGVVSPLEFYRKHIDADLASMVCLIHCPQDSKRYETVYTIEHLGNVVGGRIIRYLNVEMETLRHAAVRQVKDGKPVWFGCDVGKMLDRDLGLMDLELYDYESLYGVRFGMSKAERLDYGMSEMTHAMVFTGVDLDEEDRPRKWRVENSWGEKGGDKGFMVMTDAWFGEYLYEVVVERQYVPESLLPALETEPVRLPPWDPMGALAS